MNYFESFILGIIQGITEFFPISSSGHLLMGRKFFNIFQYNLLIEIALHIGTLFSIILYWRKDYLDAIKKGPHQRNNILLLLAVGSIPAAFVGFFYKDKLQEIFFNINSISYLIISYLCMSILLLLSKYYFHNKEKEISIYSALLIGISQAIAIIPGISRSGITIVTALFIGIKFEVAMKFSFMLLIPILVFAGIESVISNYYLLLSDYNLALFLLFGILSSAISGFLIISLLEKIIKKNKFWYFSFYCLFIALILLIFNYGN